MGVFGVFTAFKGLLVLVIPSEPATLVTLFLGRVRIVPESSAPSPLSFSFSPAVGKTVLREALSALLPALLAVDEESRACAGGLGVIGTSGCPERYAWNVVSR